MNSIDVQPRHHMYIIIFQRQEMRLNGLVVRMVGFNCFLVHNYDTSFFIIFDTSLKICSLDKNSYPCFL